MKVTLIAVTLIVILAACQSNRPHLSDVPTPPSPTLRDEIIRGLQEE